MDEQAQTQADNEALAVSPEQTLSDASTVAQTEAQQPEKTEQTATPKDSRPSEIELLKAELEQERKERREELKRIKQSFRDTGDSVLARVRDELTKRGGLINELEQEGVLTKEEAVIKRAKLREQVESEVLTTHAKERETATQSQREQAQVRVANETASIFQASGISPTDPEYSQLPNRIPLDDPDEAIEWYRQQVQAVAKKKNARVNQAAQQVAERKETAKQNAVIADTGAGGAMPPSNPEKELQQLLMNPPSEPRERLAWKKKIEMLSRQF